MTLDSNQAGQHGPSGEGLRGRSTSGWGHAGSLRGTPDRAAAGFEAYCKPSTAPNLRVKHSQRRCEL